MDYFSPGLGFFLILLGFLVKKFPMLIAGYNTMSDSEKKSVEIDGLSTHMKKVLIGMGILVMILDPVLTWLDLANYSSTSFSVIILGGVVFLVVTAQRFQDTSKTPKSKQIIRKVFTVLILGSTIVFVGMLMYKGTKSPEFTITDKVIIISGMNGMQARMLKVELLDTIPKIKHKDNGFSNGQVRKGRFTLEELGSCDLYIESLRGPHILIKTSTGTPLIINTESENQTMDLLRRLKEEIEK